MKKILLSAILASSSFLSYSQIIFQVEAPASIAGNYQFSHTNDWGQLPDMSIPANAIQNNIVFATDSLLCSPATNAAALAGKVAVLYRGTCEFGLKVFNAQQAGAIAAIVVNNAAGTIAMGPGTDGPNVTIPSWMISNTDGALLRARTLANETVSVFFGNKIGYYNNDLGVENGKYLISTYQAIPHLVAQNGNEFAVEIGSWVRNYGSNAQTGITLNATVTGGASTYNNTSAAISLASGDSIWVAMPQFSLSSYAIGEYTITYTIASAAAEQYPSDNVRVSKFNITADMLAVARLDANGMPTIDTGFKPSTAGEFYTCIPFIHPNADRLGVAGLYFGASTIAPEVLTDAEVVLTAYKWDDIFTDYDGTDMLELTDLGSVSYIYTEDKQAEIMYAPLDFPFALQNNQKYLFCLSSSNTNLYFGYDQQTNYNENENIANAYLMPSYIKTANGWGFGFSNDDSQPTVGVRLIDKNTLGIATTNAVEASVYPNPSRDFITVKINNFDGAADLNVTDLSGKVVYASSVKVEAGKLKLDINSLESGMYVFNMKMANGTVSTFKVSVNK